MDTDHRQPARGEFDWSGWMLFLISISAILLCLVIVGPFLPAITGAIVLAVVTQRPHRWIRARLRNKTLAATASLLMVVLSIVVPAFLIALSLGQHIPGAVRSLQNGATENSLHQFFDQVPHFSAMLQYTLENVDIAHEIEMRTGSFAGGIAAILGGSIAAFVQVVIMLFMLFFLYRDRDEGLAYLRSISPLDGKETDYLLARIRTAIHALVLGRFVVAGTQGLVAGITYALLGVSGASLLGVATMLFALVPAVGAFVIWLPIVIYLAVLHQWIQAAILLAVGALIISSLDNFLYPILVGSHLRLHTVPIFLSMLGGVVLFGVSGLILGPITFSVSEALILILRRRATGVPLPA